MELAGEYHIPAAPHQVWQFLNDEAILMQCLPGIQKLERTSETTFSARSKMKIGPVSASFSGSVELFDLDPPSAYSIKGEGKGGTAGFAKGNARIELEENEEGGTRLRYSGDAKVGGKLAQLGARLVSASAKKMADEFFASLCEVIEAGEKTSGEDSAEHLDKKVTEDAEASGKEMHMTGNDHGHESPAGGITTEPAEIDDSDIGAGAELGVWVTALLCVVLILLAIFGL